MGRERIEMNFGYGYGVSMRLDDPNYFSRVGSGSDFFSKIGFRSGQNGIRNLGIFNLLSVPKFTKNPYCKLELELETCAQADAVQICGNV